MLFLSQIKAVRKATKQEKKRKAMALRKKELGALGMHVRRTQQLTLDHDCYLHKPVYELKYTLSYYR